MQHFVALGVLTALVLAGCGLISTPPINDPLKLDGKTISASFPLVTAIKANPKPSIATFTFDNLTDLPSLSTTPSGFELRIGFSSGEVTGSCTAPNTINVSLTSISFQVSDDQGTVAIGGGPVTFKLNKGTGSAYTVSNLSTTALGFTQGSVGTLLNILKAGGKNTLQGSMDVEVDDALAGCTLTLTLGGTTGTIKF